MKAKPFKLALAVVILVAIGALVICLKDLPSANFRNPPPEKHENSTEQASTAIETTNKEEMKHEPTGSPSSVEEKMMRSAEEWEKHGFIVEVDTRVEHELSMLKTVLQNYRRAFGEYPAGDSAAIIQALSGDNLRKIKFMAPKGELLDPWGMPYQFTTNDKAGALEIRSAGPDHLFWTQDDVRSVLDRQR